MEPRQSQVFSCSQTLCFITLPTSAQDIAFLTLTVSIISSHKLSWASAAENMFQCMAHPSLCLWGMWDASFVNHGCFPTAASTWSLFRAFELGPVNVYLMLMQISHVMHWDNVKPAQHERLILCSKWKSGGWEQVFLWPKKKQAQLKKSHPWACQRVINTFFFRRRKGRARSRSRMCKWFKVTAELTPTQMSAEARQRLPFILHSISVQVATHPCRTRFPTSATATNEGWHMKCCTSEASSGDMTQCTQLELKLLSSSYPFSSGPEASPHFPSVTEAQFHTGAALPYDFTMHRKACEVKHQVSEHWRKCHSLQL